MVLKHSGQHVYHQFQRSKLVRSVYFLQLKLIVNQSNLIHNFIPCLCKTYINILLQACSKVPFFKNFPPKNLYGFPPPIFLMHDIHPTVSNFICSS